MRVKPLVDFSAYVVVRLFLCLIQALPLGVCKTIADQLGWVCWRVLRLRRKVIEENLRTAFPEASDEERSRTALAMWQHLFLMVVEIAHAPRKVHRTNWRQHSTSPQMKEVLGHLIDERPTIMICGHLGNFEMGGYLIALHGFPTHTVARPLDNPYLERFINEFRGKTGQFMLPKQGSSEQIERLLQQGGTLGLLGDQDAGRRGCWVDFFGKPASTHKAVALFTLGGQAPTAVCASIRRAPMHFEMIVADVVDPRSEEFQYGSVPLLAGWYTNCLEELIRIAPEQYWWVHRRWKAKPKQRPCGSRQQGSDLAA